MNATAGPDLDRTTVPTRAGVPAAARSTRVTARSVLASEWIKLRSLRSIVWAQLAVILAIVVVGMFTAVGIVVQDAPPAAEAVAADPSGGSLAGVQFAELAAIALGVLVVTTEYRSRTIRSSFAAVSRRVPLVWAKAVVAAVPVVGLALAALLVTFFAARAVVAIDDASISLASPGVVRAIVGAALTLGLTAALATSVAWLLRSTAGAVAGLVALLYVPPSLAALLPAGIAEPIGPYLPSNAADAASRLPLGDGGLAPWAGLAVYAGYAVLALAVAAVVVRRRDA